MSNKALQRARSDRGRPVLAKDVCSPGRNGARARPLS
jgi:hypothetical protein